MVKLRGRDAHNLAPRRGAREGRAVLGGAGNDEDLIRTETLHLERRSRVGGYLFALWVGITTAAVRNLDAKTGSCTGASSVLFKRYGEASCVANT